MDCHLTHVFSANVSQCSKPYKSRPYTDTTNAIKTQHTHNFIGRLRRFAVAKLNDLLCGRQELATSRPRTAGAVILTHARRT